MNLHAIIANVFFEPAFITADAHASIRAMMGMRFGDGIEARAPGRGMCGERVEVEQMAIANGIAHIPINGVVGQKMSPFERGGGAVDTLDIRREMNQAEADPAVRAIVLDIDSPGGMVTGTHETAMRIEACKKPVFAFSNGMMASAAYYIASAADAIITTHSATVGSIGVLLPWIDESRAFEARGLRVELIKAGDYKGLGFPGTSLSKEQRELLQHRVNELYSTFVGFVKKHRTVQDESTFQGQPFTAKEGLRRGLLDDVVGDKSELLSAI